MDMKQYSFLDESTIWVDDSVCRGCFLETTSDLPCELEPIAYNEEIIIRQDAECAVPGFYIVSTRKHINSIADMPHELAAMLGVVIQVVRQGQREVLGIDRVHIYLEEKIINPHFHVWLLPLYPEIMKENDIEPKIWNNTIKRYLDLFLYSENREKITEFNMKMKKYIKDHQVLNKLGF